MPRHIVVDTDGRLLMVDLTSANVQDALSAEAVIKAVRGRWRWLKHLCTDGAYDGERLMSVAAYRNFVVDIVCKLHAQQGFQPRPRRWVVERTCGWMDRWRRLVRDYERRCDVAGAMIRVRLGALLLRRISHP